MDDNFGMARALSKLVELAGWLVIVGAGLLVFFNMNARDFSSIALAGLAVALAGVLMIVAAQLTRAQVATAENTARVAVGIERLLAANAAPPSVAARTVSSSKIVKQIHGYAITREEGGYGIDGQVFTNLGQAESYARRNPKD